MGFCFAISASRRKEHSACVASGRLSTSLWAEEPFRKRTGTFIIAEFRQ